MELSTETTTHQAELTRITAQLEKLVGALCHGTPAAIIRDRMQALEDRRALLEAELQTAPAPAPRLDPGLATLYRQRVAELTGAPESVDATATREAVRSLMEDVRLVPQRGALPVELHGELTSMPELATELADQTSVRANGGMVTLGGKLGGLRGQDLNL